MKLSVIIVNYNVEFFLEQCLQSVKKALNGIESEIWVVDNNSVDQSINMLGKKFPDVHLIANKSNPGFAVANNQAIRNAKGEYILLLNPDTIVEENTFQKTISFLETHPKAAALGVKMLDGKGNFLPESKRGLPTPIVSLYKMIGLSKLFPKSKHFGRYHLGFLNKEEIHKVDVLAGAFMMIRKSVLNEIGLLDENFFMYGEDIDLSYRIIKAGYQNIYFPETSIIHYKGESTKKNSLNYVLVFYQAMMLFAQKHFSGQQAKVFRFLIQFAIYGRAFLAVISRFLHRIYVPLIDLILLYSGLYIIQEYWEKTYLFTDAYPWYYASYILASYASIWILSGFLGGAYDRPYLSFKSIKGTIYGTLFILIIYSLLPESLRFSRAIILFGTLWGILSLSLIRSLLGALKFKEFSQNSAIDKRLFIIGEKDETKRVSDLIRSTANAPGFIAFVSTTKKDQSDERYIGHLDQLKELIAIYKINELIFCSSSLSISEIIYQMAELSADNVDFKIAPNESNAIIGSNSITHSSNLYIIDIDGITKSKNKRTKRIFDFIVSTLLLISYPITSWFISRKASYFRNLISVVVGNKSIIGYDNSTFSKSVKLPSIKEGILFPRDAFEQNEITEEVSTRLNIIYAKDYKLNNDFKILVKGFRFLGR